VIRSLYQDKYPAPETSGDMTATHFADGMIMRHDRKNKITTLSALESGGTLVLEAKNIVIRTGEQGYYQLETHGKATRLTHEGGSQFKVETWSMGVTITSVPDYGFKGKKITSPAEG